MTNKEAVEVIKSMGFICDAMTQGNRRRSIYEALTLAIKALEERPQGEWVFDSNFTDFGNPYGTYKCSECGSHSSDKYSFCKDCGADMQVKDEL